jgi:glycosyltransferase involved in cell wall biosynthesis
MPGGASHQPIFQNDCRMNRPLLSFLVLSYNQEAFIRDAIAGALAQTYSPLEVIIADDHSRDGSFAIAQQMAAAYQGPHTVRLTRSDSNSGLAGQLNRTTNLWKGELVLVAAGDDVSLPNRAEVTFQAWEHSGRKATSLFSSYTIMSHEGVVEGVGGLRGHPGDEAPFRVLTGDLEGFLMRKLPVVNGCTHAWSPEVFSYFGPLTSNLEDLVLSFRTLAIGQMVYIHEPLVKYRRHQSNVSFLAEKDDTRSFEHRESRLRWVDAQSVHAYDDMLHDIATLQQRRSIGLAEGQRLTEVATRRRNAYALERDLMAATLAGRWRALAAAAARGCFRDTVRHLPRALPHSAYRALYLLRARWQARWRRQGSLG